jgi:hypothetical protein
LKKRLWEITRCPVSSQQRRYSMNGQAQIGME